MTFAWLLWAPTTRAQFNDTYRFTFTSADGLCDFDGASKAAFDGEPFTLDSETGYRTSAGRSSGASGCWFVGTGVSVEGRGIWKPNADTSDPPDPVHAFLYQANQQFQSVLDTENYFNVSADNTTLLDVHGRELRSYELRFTHMPDSQMEFHNMTVDVPIRTQAPNKEAFQQQATLIPVIEDGKVNPTMSLGFTTKSDQFRDMWAQRKNSTTAPSPLDSTVPRFVGASDSASQQSESQPEQSAAPKQDKQTQQSQDTQSSTETPQSGSQSSVPPQTSESQQPSQDPGPPPSSTQEAQPQTSSSEKPSTNQPTQPSSSQKPTQTSAPSSSESKTSASGGKAWAVGPAVSNAPPATAGNDKDGMAVGLTQTGRRRNLRERRHTKHDKRLDIPHEIVDGALLLMNGTELSYKVPASTTLIRVLGPVGRNQTAYGSQCYADLDPAPPARSWWVNGSFPLSASQKVMREDNRTLFLLPVDPEVRTTVRVGPLGLDAYCYVSGFTSYPFHYNYTHAELAPTNGTNATTTVPPKILQSSDPSIPSNPSIPSSASSGSGSKSSKTGVIVGSVVGVVGGLILLALLALFCIRRRKSDEPDDIDPYLISEKDLYRYASTPGDNTPPEDSVENRPRGPRVVQEEDADDAVVYLPPRYRERTAPNDSSGLGTPEPGSTPPLSTPDLSYENTSLLLGAEAEGKPTLQEEYLKNLGIVPGAIPERLSLKKPPRSPTSGSGSSTPLLKRAYGRLFGSAPPSEAAGPSQAKGWKDDVKTAEGLMY